MNKGNSIWIYPLVVFGLFIILTGSCKKKEDAPTLTSPEILWAHPADIDFGTKLGPAQLNATLKPLVSGRFEYTPGSGTMLNQGVNQSLSVVFIPDDKDKYNTVSKTVKITVTSTPSTVTDTCGNVYHTITIGSQVWMVENLGTSCYNDGTAIPLVTRSSWNNPVTPAHCWFNDSAVYKNGYGALYNWYAVNTDKLAPKGWRIPTITDWTTLIGYLGGAAGCKMKSFDTWVSPNTDATNESGFTAVAAGFRSENGVDGNHGAINILWSFDTSPAGGAKCIQLWNDSCGAAIMNWNKSCGMSVRCIKK
jgi:uncharacterized protein (TIGR02145 family)